MKVDEIKKKLDELEIEYDDKAKKDELLDLLKEQRQDEPPKENKEYIVVYPIWKDLEDNDYIYKKGEPYPRTGYTPTEERIAELTSKNNKIGKVLIKETD